MNATVRPFQLLLASPLATARGTIDAREGFLFDVTADTACLGEATPLFPFTESKTDSHDALQRAATRFADTGWTGALREVSATDETGSLQYPAARHAVSLAYLVWQSKEALVPLYRQLGGPDVRNVVPVNATIGDAPTETTVATGESAAEDGYQAVKVKVGDRPVEEDIERIRALDDAVGADVAIRVDANGAWSVDTAEAFVDATASLDLDYVEQPLDPDDIEGHAALADRGVDIALDESVAMLPLDRLLEAGAAQVFVIKPMAVGGVDIARSHALTVREADHRAVFSTTIDSVIARTAAVHLAASFPTVPPCGLATGEFLAEDLAEDPAPVKHGQITVPDWPGLGINEVSV